METGVLHTSLQEVKGAPSQAGEVVTNSDPDAVIPEMALTPQ